MATIDAAEAPRNRVARLRRLRHSRLPIAAHLAIALGLLASVPVAIVLALTLLAAGLNTVQLLGDKSRLLLQGVVAATNAHLAPAEAQVQFLAERIESGILERADLGRLTTTMQALLGATPQVSAIVFFDPDGVQLIALRGENGIDAEIADWRDVPSSVAAMADARERPRGRSYWAAPVYVERPGTMINLRRPLFNDDGFLGMVVVTVTVRQLSRFLGSLESEEGQQAFILYDREYVLAHPALADAFPGLTPRRPLPRVTEVGDPVLQHIWSVPGEPLMGGHFARGSVGPVEGHVAEINGVDYVFLYRNLRGYADAPWLIGSYFPEDSVGQPFHRLAFALAAGVLALLAAIGAALLLGRGIGRQIYLLADAATALRTLDVAGATELRRSRFREVDEAAQAFNAALGGLRAFSRYVPRDLVLRLLRRDSPALLESQAREVTVLFTDIADFTRLAADLPPQETAAFLNRHFAVIAACIEAEGGTVDKYIGDAVMAFWGAPEVQPDHAQRAARAVRAIADAVRADNRDARRPVRMRMGLDTGEVIVGDIGSPSRLNYTLVGDTVNSAERLQELGKAVDGDADIIALATAATAFRLPEAAAEHVDRVVLRGRGEPTDVYRLRV